MARLAARIALGVVTGGCLGCHGAAPQVDAGAAPTASSPAPMPAAVPWVPSDVPMAWVHVNGATGYGPEVPSGRLVLLGGRRAIATPAGDLQPEKTRCPEALIDIRSAVTKTGRAIVVGMGTETLYRFDDPLGAPIPLARFPRGALAGSSGGRTFVRGGEGVPCGRREPCDLVSVDLDTGKIAGATPPSLPVERPSPPVPESPSPTLQWIRATHRDPLLAAITNGALLEDGTALAMAGATAATIALPSGRVREVVQLGKTSTGMDMCRAVRAGPRVWVACEVEDRAGNKTQISLVSSVSPLVLRPVVTTKRHFSSQVIRGGASGDLFFYDSDGAMLITPVGATPFPFPTAEAPKDIPGWTGLVWFIGDDTILPMSDGRIMFLRVKRMEQQVASLQQGGVEKQIARLADDWNPVRLIAEDDATHVKIFGWPHHKEPQLATVTIPGGAVTLEPVTGLACPPDDCNWQLAMSDRRGMAVRVHVGMADTGPHGPETFQLRVAGAVLTRDGARTWTKLGVPSGAVASASRMAIPGVGMGGVRAVANDVGMVIGKMARVGWVESDDTAIGEVPER